MSGVTIIEEVVCREMELVSVIGTSVLFSVLVAMGFAMYWSMYKRTQSRAVKNTIIVCSILLIAILVWAVAFNISQYNTTHMEYIVEVTDEASYLEFTDTYTVISRDGNRFRVLENTVEGG